MSMPRRASPPGLASNRKPAPWATTRHRWCFWGKDILAWRDDARETIVPEAVVRGPMKKLIAANVAE
jgi:hypothetical protein